MLIFQSTGSYVMITHCAPVAGADAHAGDVLAIIGHCADCLLRLEANPKRESFLHFTLAETPILLSFGSTSDCINPIE